MGTHGLRMVPTISFDSHAGHRFRPLRNSDAFRMGTPVVWEPMPLEFGFEEQACRRKCRIPEARQHTSGDQVFIGARGF